MCSDTIFHILLVVVLLASLVPAIMVYRRHEKGTAR